MTYSRDTIWTSSVGTWWWPSTPSSSSSPISSSPFSGALMGNVFSKLLDNMNWIKCTYIQNTSFLTAENKISKKEKIRFFQNLSFYKVKMYTDIKLMMNNTIRNSFASMDLHIGILILFNVSENFLPKWKESLVLSEFHNVQRGHALSRQKLEEQCRAGCWSFNSHFSFVKSLNEQAHL